MGKKMEPEIKHMRAMWRAFTRLPEDAKRPALRWMTDRYTFEQQAKTRAADAVRLSTDQHGVTTRA